MGISQTFKSNISPGQKVLPHSSAAQLTLSSDDATTDGNTVGADWHEAIGSLDVHRPRPDPCEVGTSQHAHAQRLLVRGVGGSKLLDTAMILTLPRVGVTIIQTQR